MVLVSAISTAIFSLAFAFSTNFALSVVLRFIVGFLNGQALSALIPFSLQFVFLIATTSISKAFLSKWSNDYNHALGMSVAITSYGAGLVIAPALSSFLADPLNQYNLTDTSKSSFSLFS